MSGLFSGPIALVGRIGLYRRTKWSPTASAYSAEVAPATKAWQPWPPAKAGETCAALKEPAREQAMVGKTSVEGEMNGA